MTCTEFNEVVHELLRPEQPASESVRRGLEHALLCDDCAAVLAGQRDLNDQLDDLADADRAVAAPAHLERNLLAALREQHALKPAATPVWRWVAALGLASAAVLVGAILIVHRPADGPAGPAAQPATPRTGSPSMPLEASKHRLQARQKTRQRSCRKLRGPQRRRPRRDHKRSKPDSFTRCRMRSRANRPTAIP